VGLGGLGHMAVKLAKAMAASVTVLSHSPGKHGDALRLGADESARPSDRNVRYPHQSQGRKGVRANDPPNVLARANKVIK